MRERQFNDATFSRDVGVAIADMRKLGVPEE